MVVLLSGGLDSTVLAATCEPALAVSVDYGQRHRRELDAAAAVAAELGLAHLVVPAAGLGSLLASSLTGHGPVPEGHYADPAMADTIVPNRNAILISIAAGIAASHGLPTVYVAAHGGDSAVYPDCRPDFIRAADELARLACGVRVLAPLLGLDKAGVVELGLRSGAPMHLSWTCYLGGKLHCGRCGACVERREAFELAGAADPASYAL